jgi:urease subunit alpha
MFGALGGARLATRMTFLSQAAVHGDIAGKLGLKSLLGTVKQCRNITKSHMKLNDYQPCIEVNPQTYQVKADGELLACEPANELPMAQRYFLF